MALSVKNMRAGDYPDAFKFTNIGDGFNDADIVSIRELDRTDLNGKPQHNYIFQVRLQNEEETTVWAPEGKGIIRAIKAAAVEANLDSVEEGGKMSLHFTSVGTPSQPGFSPPKQFTASVKAPVASVSVDDI